MEPSTLREIVGAMTPVTGYSGATFRLFRAQDATGLAALRNHAEALLDVVEAAEEILHAPLLHSGRSDDDATMLVYREDAEVLRAALARVKEIK